MTPEREAEIRAVSERAGRRCVNNRDCIPCALSDTLAELDAIRAKVTEYDRAHLRCLMSDISEDYWCAGWLDQLEFELWRAITTDDTGFGPFGTNLSETELADLKRLSESAGGWFAWGEDADGDVGAQFVPMAEWVERYAREIGLFTEGNGDE